MKRQAGLSTFSSPSLLIRVIRVIRGFSTGLPRERLPRRTLPFNGRKSRAKVSGPECENEVKFYIRDFDKHWNSDFSNLDEKDFIGSPKDQAFLDFYCPECFLPTTVIYGL